MESVQTKIDRERLTISRRAAKGFDNTWHLERLAHLEACLHDDHEFSECIDISTSGKSGVAQLRCLWCDKPVDLVEETWKIINGAK